MRAGTATAARSSRPTSSTLNTTGCVPTISDRWPHRARSTTLPPVLLSGPTLAALRGAPDFIQPETRRNEIISLIQNDGLHNVNITRAGERLGHPRAVRRATSPSTSGSTPCSPTSPASATATTGRRSTATGRRTSTSSARTSPASTRPVWPAMLWAAGEQAPKQVFGHGFVYFEGGKISKSRADELKKSARLDYLLEPMEIVRRFSTRGVPLLLPARVPVPRRRRVQPRPLHGGIQLGSWRTTWATCSEPADHHPEQEL